MIKTLLVAGSIFCSGIVFGTSNTKIAAVCLILAWLQIVIVYIIGWMRKTNESRLEINEGGHQ